MIAKIGQKERLIICIFLLLVIAFITRLNTLNDKIFEVDEAIYSVSGGMIQNGHVMYRDIWDHGPPLIYYSYAAIFAFFGQYNLAAVHCVLVFVVWLEATLIFQISRSRYGTLIGLIAGILFLVFSIIGAPWDVLAANKEFFGLLPLLLGILLQLRLGSSFRLNLLALFTSGFLLGIAVGFKQTFLLFVPLPAVAFLRFYTIAENTNSVFTGKAATHLTTSLVLYMLGFLIPFAIMCAYFIRTGAWDDFYFLNVTYNFEYYAPVKIFGLFHASIKAIYRLVLDFQWGFLIALPFYGLISNSSNLQKAFRKVRFNREILEFFTSPSAFLALWVVLGAVAVSMGGPKRLFQYYFILLLPPLCILTGKILYELFKYHRKMAVTLILVWVVIPLCDTSHPSYEKYAKLRERLKTKVCEAIPPEEESKNIFVWGFFPEIYVWTKSTPASRYIICHALSGQIPGVNYSDLDTSDKVIPGSKKIFLSDLHRTKPEFFIDTSPGNHWGYGKYSLPDEIRNYVNKFYQVYREIKEGGKVYLRIYKRQDQGLLS
jgi:hypothetical protein